MSSQYQSNSGQGYPLKNGSHGQDVLNLQCVLASLNLYTGDFDGCFGSGTQAAVLIFQSKSGLPATGVVDDATAKALSLPELQPAKSSMSCITAELIVPMFPCTPLANIQSNLPYVLNALTEVKLGDHQMVLMALATIRAETASFLPVSECQSPLNTSPGGKPFDLYDHKTELGNQGPPDGANYRGRGFVQLTGRANFQVHGQAIGLGETLLTSPTLAHDPQHAARLLASFLNARATRIRNALATNNLAEARRLVNGGSNGLKDFEDAYNAGSKIITENVCVIG